VLTKLVLCATTVGACRLVEVPFGWRQGDPLPLGAFELTFPSPVEALKALAERGRKQNRIHVPRPERKPQATPLAEPSPVEQAQP
jgi:hypothetical protein